MTSIQGTSSATSAWSADQSNGPNLRPFANLDLTDDQRTKIRSILQQARQNKTSPDQVNSQIEAVLTDQQKATFESDLQNLPKPGGPPPDGDGPSLQDLLSNLNLTDTQKTQISSILQQVQSGQLSQSDALTQIKGLLTSDQQTALDQDVQTAQALVAGHRHHHHGGSGDATSSTTTGSSTATATIPGSGLSETDVQNQVAAADSLILNQLQAQLGIATTA